MAPPSLPLGARPPQAELPHQAHGHEGQARSRPAHAPDPDDLYDRFVERLRRDLLAERERMGDLFGDLL